MRVCAHKHNHTTIKMQCIVDSMPPVSHNSAFYTGNTALSLALTKRAALFTTTTRVVVYSPTDCLCVMRTLRQTFYQHSYSFITTLFHNIFIGVLCCYYNFSFPTFSVFVCIVAATTFFVLSVFFLYVVVVVFVFLFCTMLQSTQKIDSMKTYNKCREFDLVWFVVLNGL